MTERLDRIEAGLEATQAICGSNARAIQATGEQIGELRNTVEAFIQKLDAEGLRVTLITEVADDIGGDVTYLERQVNRQDVSIAALREDAIADRQAFREQAEADRAALREEMAAARSQADTDRVAFRDEMAAARAQTDANRQTSDQRFEESNRRFDAQLAEIRAQGEQIRALLSALASTNGRVDNLEQAS